MRKFEDLLIVLKLSTLSFAMVTLAESLTRDV